MYLADNENDNIRAINISLDFSEIIAIPECRQDMTAWINANIKTIDTKVLNGRKISIKVGIELQIKVFSRENIEIVNKINEDNIQVLEKNLLLNSQIGEGSGSAFVKDTITLDMDDELAEILKVDVRLVDKDIKISYNKILAKAEAEIKVMYLTEGGNIKFVSAKMPLVGFVDILNVQEENICDTTYEIKNIIIRPNTENGNSIYVEIETQIYCVAYENKSINLICDLYSLLDKLVIEEEKVDAISNKCKRKDICKIRENVKIPEINANSLLDVDIYINIINKIKLSSNIVYEGEMSLNIIYKNEGNIGINTKKINVPFEFNLENANDLENFEIDSNIEILKQDFSVQNDGNIECSVDLLFDMDMYKNESIEVIYGINSEEDDTLEDYSVIIYVVKKDDSLWNIAKKFKSTVDDIVRTNGIENPNIINIGEKIYIPKYTKKYETV
jgi:hypothetical protein